MEETRVSMGSLAPDMTTSAVSIVAWDEGGDEILPSPQGGRKSPVVDFEPSMPPLIVTSAEGDFEMPTEVFIAAPTVV